MASRDRHGAPDLLEQNPSFADRTLAVLLILSAGAFAVMLIWLLGR